MAVGTIFVKANFQLPQIQLSDQFSSWGVESKELRSERSYCAMVEE